MASCGDEYNVGISQDQEEKKAAAVSFGFNKTVSKFKSNREGPIKEDERDYLTGVDGKELLRYATQLG